MPVYRTEYAVRVKGTHCYLPRPQRRDGRGGSHLEPVDFSDPSSWPKRYAKDMQIRSYSTEKAAKNLLSSWLQGKFVCYRGGDAYDNYYEDMEIRRTPHRIRENMEVVEIKILLPDPEEIS